MGQKLPPRLPSEGSCKNNSVSGNGTVFHLLEVQGQEHHELCHCDEEQETQGIFVLAQLLQLLHVMCGAFALFFERFALPARDPYDDFGAIRIQVALVFSVKRRCAS